MGCKAAEVAEAGVCNGTVQSELGEEGGREGAGGEAVRQGKSVDTGAVIGGNAVGGLGGIAGEGEGPVRPRWLGGGSRGRGRTGRGGETRGGWLGGGAMSERAVLRRLGWFRSFFLGGGLTGLSGRKKGSPPAVRESIVMV